MTDARRSLGLRRSHFLAGATALPFTLAAAPLAPPADPTERVGAALVLGGGGARGAYEAGIVEGLRRAANVRDGERIPGIDVVCGTSIGSVNAWFVATAQYSALATLWHGIAAEHVFEVKRRFAATAKPGAFIITKIIQALALAQGLTKNVQGILEGDNVATWIEKHIDPQLPLLVPFTFTATNLDRERAEVFYRLPFAVSAATRASAIARLRSSVGPATAVRPATDALLRPAIRASAAVPVLFDPIELPAPEGGMDRYIDGGIADNTPIDVGRALSTAVYAVMVDAADPARQPYANALTIGVGAFGVTQTRILEASLRAAYLETRGKRIFADAARTSEQRHFLTSVLDSDLFTIRPGEDLPVAFVEFDRQAKIDAAYDAGVRDIAHGWKPYVYGALPASIMPMRPKTGDCEGACR